MPKHKAVLVHYIRLTEFLANVLGPHYEISLYDLTLKNKPLIAIANRHITKRIIGEPPNTEEEIMIKEGIEKDQNFSINYCTYSISGRQIRTSSFFIKSSNNELIGLFCLHFDDSRFLDISKAILGLCHPDNFVNYNLQFDLHYKEYDNTELPAVSSSKEIEHFHMNGISNFIHEFAEHENLNLHKLNQKDKLKIIHQLYNSGLMSIKGSINQVAEELYCSASSVYRYLGSIKKVSPS